MNKEERKEYNRQWHSAHRERESLQKKAYYEANKESIRKKQQKYAEANREKHRERAKQYAKGHREQARQKASKYYWGHREKCLLAGRNRRDKVKTTVFELLGGKCRRCGNNDIRVLQVNHINGGGTKDKHLISRNLYKKIASGERVAGDFNLLCANCNVLYEYERGYRK